MGSSVWNLETFLLLVFTGLLLFGFHRLTVRQNRYHPASIEDYLFKLARITRQSEHAIFHEAARDWPVAETTVEKDFKDYLLNQAIPYYVNDFIRKNKHYMDNWRFPPY